MSLLRGRLAIALVTFLVHPAWAQTSTSSDAKVQAPQIKAPERASLVGQLASVAFGPADVTRGAFTLPSPLSAPNERGAPLASPFPSYSPDAGISEWGVGWQARLTISRLRVQGTLDYLPLSSTGDELESPFGRLLRGTDGNWYPLGLSRLVRVVESGDTLVAYLPDGTRMTFGGRARVTTAAGTYGWSLAEAATVTGRKMRLEWTANASGRLFVTRAWYGGVGDEFQYRMDFAHETVMIPFEDYRSGALQTLDRRVKAVTIYAKHASTGTFEERWRYELGYVDDAFGPAFYLANAQQVFRSGARPPATTYGYNHGRDRLAAAQLTPAPRVSQLLASVALDVLQPNKSASFDAEDDGMPDLEWAYDYRLLRQTATGFASEPLQAAPGAFGRCWRPANSYNTPRVLSRFRGGAGDETSYVIDLQWDGYGSTVFSTCTRAGTRLAYSSLAQNWALGATVRLVDVNRDHKPDLVRLSYGAYKVLPNTSTATTFSFGVVKTGTLTPAFTPDTAWVHDFNGDGIPDLIGRYSGGIVVWYGKGNGEFVSQGRGFTVRIVGGSPISSFSSYALTFVDANKDGLTDILLAGASGNATSLFMNRGTSFEEVRVPGLQAVDMYMSKPVVLDTSGSGNTEVAFSKSSQGFTVALDGPETGLMAWADDGRGTVLSFEYGRAAPSAGGKQRQTVLARVAVQSSGQGALSYSYAYGAPKLHSFGKFLLGYDQVQRTTPLGLDWSQFLHEDDIAGLPLASTSRDALVAGLEQFAEKSYEDAAYQGIPWKRLISSVSGWRATDGSGASVSERTRTTAWWSDFCPAQTVKETRAGASSHAPVDPSALASLTTDTQYATLPAFSGHLSCLTADVVESGVHPDPNLDFRNQTVISRNDVGLVTRVVSVADSNDTWTVQEVTYTREWLVESVSAPGLGTTTATYDPITRLLQRVTSPEGVIVEAAQRDPLTGGATLLRTRRGLLVHEQHFTFDGQERLESAWDNLGTGSQLNPLVRYSYAFATGSTPATIATSQLVDSASTSVRDRVDLLTAGGQAVTSGNRIPEGWALGSLTWRDSTTGQTTSYLRRAMVVTSLEGTDYTTLFAGADQVGSATAGPFGVASRNTVVHGAVGGLPAVQQSVVESLGLDVANGRLARNARENGTYDRTTTTNASGQPIASWDEAGTPWEYVRDVLGRVRVVRLPDGRKHLTEYDGHGRVSRVVRDGIAAIEYVYDPVTGLLHEKRFSAPSGAVRRTVTFKRDGFGRVTMETHTDAVSGATKTFAFFFDGSTPMRPSAATATGLLTAVTGDGFARRNEYRADGKAIRRTVEIGTWRKIVCEFRYDEAGNPSGETVGVYNGETPLVSTSKDDRYDHNGRVVATALGGVTFATYGYGSEGRLESVSFANGDGLTLLYDRVTRRQTGSIQATQAFTASTLRRMNDRALVHHEDIDVGPLSLSRSYEYSNQRFLASSSDAQSSHGYTFDASGLPLRIREGTITFDLVQSGNHLFAGEVRYVFDDLGRTVQRGDLVLAYGPDGQLARATRGSRTWSYIYDETGHRLAKLENGTPIAAYLAEGFLDAAQLVQPVKIAGRTVGLIRNGTFATVATDLAGTVFADPSGQFNLASPFGRRGSHPDMAAVVEYVDKGFDADIGLIRMGVRDYDPDIGRFVTPDPLLLERPHEVAQRPHEANLYSYAANNPIGLADSNGTDVHVVAWADYPRLGDRIEAPGGGMLQNGSMSPDGAFEAAARTRIAEIKAGPSFNPAKDTVVGIDFRTMNELKTKIEAFTQAAEVSGFGKTVEFSIFSHGGVDGPTALRMTDRTGAGPRFQLTADEWKQVKFNWADRGTLAVFYHCRSLSFAQAFRSDQNIDIAVGSAFKVYPSSSNLQRSYPFWDQAYLVPSDEGSGFSAITGGAPMRPWIAFTRDGARQVGAGNFNPGMLFTSP